MKAYSRLIRFFRDIKYSIRNRWITKQYLGKTRLNKNEWHEHDDKIIHVNFEIFMDYIEEFDFMIESDSVQHEPFQDHESYEYQPVNFPSKYKIRPYNKNQLESFKRVNVYLWKYIQTASKSISDGTLNDFDEHYEKQTIEVYNDYLKLMRWWLQKYPAQLSTLDHMYEVWGKMVRQETPDGHLSLKHESSPETRSYLERIIQYEQEISDELEEHLLLLIKRRQTFWT